MKIGLSLLLPVLASAVMLSQTAEAPTAKSNNSSGESAAVADAPKASILPDLDKLETATSQISADIGRLHIEKWKTSGAGKSAAQANADSVQRNLKSALPELVAALRAAPDDLTAEFKLYRNLNALCNVVNSLTDATRAFGPNSDYELLAQQSQVLDSVRRSLADSLEQRTATTQQELKQARLQIRAQQDQLAAATAVSSKEVVVAQTEPPKKAPRKKKPVAQKPANAASDPNTKSSTPNASGQAPGSTSVPKS
jgi:hypothetical protein